jgi:CYTH domain-containing protein
MKYAKVERERRFLLGQVPPYVAALPARAIHDRYLPGTGLRLRVVDEPGRPTVWKLGQKIRLENTKPMAVAHTTMYLDHAEYGALAVLAAAELSKSRRVILVGGTLVAVDQFHGRLEGLILAEIGLGEPGELGSPLPLPAVAEVTDDERFSGGQLAVTTSEALRQLISEFDS